MTCELIVPGQAEQALAEQEREARRQAAMEAGEILDKKKKKKKGRGGSAKARKPRAKSAKT